MTTQLTRSTRVAETVGQWVADLRWADVPDDVRRSTVESVFQSVAGGVAGLDMPEMAVALQYARTLGETGSSTILGDGAKVPITTSLFVNSILWCSLEQQEMHVPSRTHPHEVIVPVAMVLAEQLHPDGISFLEAILAGVEVTCALGKTAVEITPDIAEGLPNTTAIFAGIGAAVTAARLLGLDAPTTAVAMCHAANFGAGLTECLRQGTTEYHWALGDASVKGWLAAKLASIGAEATTNTLEGGSGLYAGLTGLSAQQLADADLITRVRGRLGREWSMPEHIYKRYPVHFPSMPLIDGTKVLRQRHGIAPDDVAEIRIRLNAWVALCDGANLGPYTGREATRGAAAFAVGTVLARGTFGLDEVCEHDAPDIAAMVAKTKLSHFENADNNSWEQAHIEVIDTQGNSYVYDSEVEGILDYRLPMSELRSLAQIALGKILDAATVSEVLHRLETIADCDDVATLTPLLIRPADTRNAATVASPPPSPHSKEFR